MGTTYLHVFLPNCRVAPHCSPESPLLSQSPDSPLFPLSYAHLINHQVVLIPPPLVPSSLLYPFLGLIHSGHPSTPGSFLLHSMQSPGQSFKVKALLTQPRPPPSRSPGLSASHLASACLLRPSSSLHSSLCSKYLTHQLYSEVPLLEQLKMFLLPGMFSPLRYLPTIKRFYCY